MLKLGAHSEALCASVKCSCQCVPTCLQICGLCSPVNVPSHRDTKAAGSTRVDSSFSAQRTKATECQHSILAINFSELVVGMWSGVAAAMQEIIG